MQIRKGLAQVIDSEGYRANVGIILCNEAGKLFWARRIGEDAWQFPQGGIRGDESPEDALFRELHEEIGLQPDDVEVVGCTQSWLRYQIPKRFLRRNTQPVCIGQKQLWYLLLLTNSEARVRFDNTDHPEFDLWRWVHYWLPVKEVVPFKRKVYQQALSELEPLLRENSGGGQVAGCIKHR